MATRRELTRRILTPVMILLVGGAVTLWAARRTAVRLDVMQEQVTRLCLASTGGREPESLPTADGLLDRRLQEALSAACRRLPEDGEGLEVVMYHGDAPGFSERDVTAHAMIRVHDVERLGLRLTDRHGGIEIVGYWYPDPMIP